MHEKSAVVTGPTGAVGVALVQKLISENIYVYAIVRPNSNRINNIPKSPLVSVIECDISSYNKLPFLIKHNCDIFYHLAWEGTTGSNRNNKELQELNVKHALDAASAAKNLGCSTFIGVGSQAEYGRVNGILTPNTPAIPETEYGKGKLLAGMLTHKFCQEHGVGYIWVRILSVYGPYDGENSMIMSSIRKMLAGEVCQFTKGEQMWDYLYSGDAADALYLLSETGINNKIYCLGSGCAKPLKEYIEILHSIVNPSTTIQFGTIPYAEKQIMHLCADISELQKDTGFEPKTSFENGIKKTYNWVIDNTNYSKNV